MLRDLLKERQLSGRLSALDNPKMLPVLLKVASRLPPDDPIFKEVDRIGVSLLLNRQACALGPQISIRGWERVQY